MHEAWCPGTPSVRTFAKHSIDYTEFIIWRQQARKEQGRSTIWPLAFTYSDTAARGLTSSHLGERSTNRQQERIGLLSDEPILLNNRGKRFTASQKLLAFLVPRPAKNPQGFIGTISRARGDHFDKQATWDTPNQRVIFRRPLIPQTILKWQQPGPIKLPIIGPDNLREQY